MNTQRSHSGKIHPHDFHGLTIYLNYSYDADGNISKLFVSWRDPNPGPRSKKDYGKKVIEKRYNLKSSSPVHKSSDTLNKVIGETLEYVMPRFFLPALFKERKELLSGDLRLSVALPYAWEQHKNATQYQDETLIGKEIAYKKLIEDFGETKVKELSTRMVAPWFFKDKYNQKIARDCVIILRILFKNTLCNVLPELARDWRNYSTKPFRGKYSPQIQARHRLLLPIWGESEIKEFMAQCEKNIHSADAEKFFIAATMFVTGISLNEACPLTLNNFKPLAGYSGKYGLKIDQEVKCIGKKKINDKESVSIYSTYDIDDLYQRRFLALGAWHTSLLNRMLEKKNKQRCLNPPQFKKYKTASASRKFF